MKKLLFLMLSLAFATACGDDAAKQRGGGADQLIKKKADEIGNHSDQQQNDRLTEYAKGAEGGNCHKTRDTGGRGGRKQRSKQVCGATIRGRTRQHQQRRAYGYHQRKAKHYDLHVSQAVPDESVSFDPHWLDVLASILPIYYTHLMQ